MQDLPLLPPPPRLPPSSALENCEPQCDRNATQLAGANWRAIYQETRDIFEVWEAHWEAGEKYVGGFGVDLTVRSEYLRVDYSEVLVGDGAIGFSVADYG